MKIMMLGVCLALGAMVAGAQTAAIKLIGSIPMPHVTGRIDHLDADTAGRRLFVAALGNNSVEVIDLRKEAVVRTITGLEEPQGLRYLPQTNRLVVANGGNGEVRIFDAETFAPVRQIDFHEDADNVRYDAWKNLVYVGYGSGALAALDASTLEERESIRLSGHPESFQIGRSSERIYVNVPTAEIIEIVDRKEAKVSSIIRLKDVRANFPMALDEAHHELLVGCRRPPRLLVIDTETGMITGTIETHHDADDLFLDPETACAFLSCGEGFIDMVPLRGGAPGKRVSVKTPAGARTCYYWPEQKRLYLAVPAREGREACIQIYSTP